jgi:hypothetical protein
MGRETDHDRVMVQTVVAEEVLPPTDTAPVPAVIALDPAQHQPSCDGCSRCRLRPTRCPKRSRSAHVGASPVGRRVKPGYRSSSGIADA